MSRILAIFAALAVLLGGATPAHAVLSPSAPANLKAFQGGWLEEPWVTLYWESASSALPITHYSIYRVDEQRELVGTATPEDLRFGERLELGIYTFEVTATNAYGEGEAASVTIELVHPMDMTDSGSPKDLVVEPGRGGLLLTWNPPWEGDLGPSAHGYAVFRNRELIDWTSLSTLSYVDRAAKASCEPQMYHVALRWDTGFSYSSPVIWESDSPKCR